MGSDSTVTSDEWGKPNLPSPAHQGRLLALPSRDKSKVATKVKRKMQGAKCQSVNGHLWSRYPVPSAGQ